MDKSILHKPADTALPIHDLIRKRWSPRSFDGRLVSDRDLETILEAGRWAASSSNEQPWRFIVARRSDEAAWNKLFGLLIPFNQAWVKKTGVLIFVAANKVSSSGKENLYALHDAGAATTMMMLQATALGLQAHAMAGFDHTRAPEELGLTDAFGVGAAIAIGYQASADELDLEQKYKDLEVGPRTRKPLQELAFLGTLGEPMVFKHEA